jgi:hypothetical protein
MRRVVPLAVAAVLAAGCGGGKARETRGGDPPELANGEMGVGAPAAGTSPGAGTSAEASPGVPAVPDGGVAAGHGAADLGEVFARRVRGRVTVPARDVTPPLALLRLHAGADAVVHDSPVRPSPRPALRLARPEVRATALIRDTDGGTGRVRVSVVYATRCGENERQHAAYFPPAQLENVRIAPGVRVPAQRSRSGRVTFPADCIVSGKAFAEATNAHSLESFSDPVWFEYRPG